MHHATTDTLTPLAHWLGQTVPDLLSRADHYFLGLGSLLLLLALVAAVALTVGHKVCMRSLSRHLKAAALTVWLLGVAVYMVGFHDGGTSDNWIALTLRASLSAMEMFVSHSDLIEVRHELHANATYMALFSLVHFAAVLVSAMFLLRLLGLHAVSWLRLLAASAGRRRHYHVFWGVNPHSISVARSLAKPRKATSEAAPHAHRARPTLVFLNTGDGDGTPHGGHTSFASLLHHGSAADSYVHDIEQMGALLFNVGPDNRLPRLLRRCLRRAMATDGADLYFLSDRESDNLEAVMDLGLVVGTSDDSDLRTLNCYCHARNTSAHRSLLASSPLGASRIHLADTSSLAVGLLRRDPRCHPASYVCPQGGLATRPFEAMVIGFGETGRDALRFLYEFAALPATADGTPNGRHLHVVDRRLRELRTDFLRDGPALADTGDISWWTDTPTDTPAFWQRTRDLLDRLSCIIIAVGDDAEATRLATDLLELAYRHRQTLSNFHIRVRIRDSHKARLLNLNLPLSNPMHDVIVPFGADDELFTADVLLIDSLEREAKKFYYNYSVANDLLSGNAGRPTALTDHPTDQQLDDHWQARRQRPFDTPRGCENREEYRDPAAWAIMVWYQEEQDRSNHLHAATKRLLATGVERHVPTGQGFKTTVRPDIMRDGEFFRQRELPYDLFFKARQAEMLRIHPDLKDRLPDRDGRFPEGVAREEQTAILTRLYAVPSWLNNLVFAEHLRWNARMELLGYVYGPVKSYRRRTHPCLTSCADLLAHHADAIPYDESVVRVSLSPDRDI